MANEQLVNSFSKHFNSFIKTLIGGQEFLTALESIQTNCLDFPNSLLNNCLKLWSYKPFMLFSQPVKQTFWKIKAIRLNAFQSC